MSAWKLVVNFLLPPPLLLTVLILLPAPQVVKKGLLVFIRNFLFYPIAGQVRLMHFALFVTGAAFTATSLQTYRISQSPISDTLTPNQRTAVLARRWREERNFWIATLTFLLWGLLYRFYALTLEHVLVKERLRQAEAALASEGKALGAHTTSTAGAGAASAGKASGKSGGGSAATSVEPSAPPMPLSVEPGRPAGGGSDSVEPKKTK